jgi:uncharacterized lipoprotein YddW (UPF0748 family)
MCLKKGARGVDGYKRDIRSFFGIAALALGTTFPQFGHAAAYVKSSEVPPKPRREFRAVWVATVNNIDWPSQKGLSSADQKAELIKILDRVAELNLNTVIFQVRPACDAMYASRIEPWSEYLTGTMGQVPQPFYDPLVFAIDEAHKRGLELHAWFNPYRARHVTERSQNSAGHVSKTHPQLVRPYGKQLWLDPGDKEVQDYSLSVVMDVVNRYDIDGVHFDDYFYPYKENDRSGKEIEFPDEASWQRFGNGGKLSRDDWRRENINSFVERVYKSVKSAKPRVQFGISPFGIWRPENPPQIRGFDAYANLYADSRKWLVNGWVDYLAPQLYWSIDSREQSFPVLLKWWAGQNPKDRHLLAGLDSTKTSAQPKRESQSAAKWKPEEIIDQIRLTRKEQNVDGHIHWNASSLLRNNGFGLDLARNVYSEPALVPTSPWLDHVAPPKPELAASQTRDRVNLSWQAGPSTSADNAFLWLLQFKTSGKWKSEVLPAQIRSQTLESSPKVISLSAVDRLGNVSVPAVVELKGQ